MLESARALGAPRVRIWAGRVGSAGAGAAERAAVEAGVRAAVELAGDVEVALEFHGGTLTDEPASAGALRRPRRRAHVLAAAGGHAGRVALAGLPTCCPGSPRCTCSPGGRANERHRLAARADLWRAALRAAATWTRCWSSSRTTTRGAGAEEAAR